MDFCSSSFGALCRGESIGSLGLRLLAAYEVGSSSVVLDSSSGSFSGDCRHGGVVRRWGTFVLCLAVSVGDCRVSGCSGKGKLDMDERASNKARLKDVNTCISFFTFSRYVFSAVSVFGSPLFFVESRKNYDHLWDKLGQLKRYTTIET